jgi:hypothetical protein
MSADGPRSGPRHEPERIYERAADPAEAANRPLEPKAPRDELSESDDVEGAVRPDEDPHHRLNTPVGKSYEDADSDPYRPSTPDDEADHASGTRGAHQGAER